MTPQEFKNAVRYMRYLQKLVESELTTSAKERKLKLEKQIDLYLESH